LSGNPHEEETGMTMIDERPEVEVELTHPDDLNPDEELLLELLRQAEPEQFDEHLRRHVANPTEATQLVFRHPSIVEMTVDGLYRLQAAAQQRAQHARNREMRQLAQEQVRKIGREKRYFAKYLNLAVSEAAKHTPKVRAERMLGRLMYRDLKEIIRDFEAGLPEREVEKRARERLSRRPKGPKSTKT